MDKDVQNQMVAKSCCSSEEIQRINPAFYKKYVTNLQGKDFMTYNGLIALGKSKGITSINTEIIQYPTKENDQTCIVKATVEGGEEINGKIVKVTYTGIGDANPANCNKMVGRHFIRMAETRAKGRALRDFLGIDMTMSEELGGTPYESIKPENTKATSEQMSTISKLMKEGGWSQDEMKALSSSVCGTSNVKEYTQAMANHLIERMKKEIVSKNQA